MAKLLTHILIRVCDLVVCVVSSLTIKWLRKRELVAFAILLLCVCLCLCYIMSLVFSAMGLSVIFDCGFSCSYTLVLLLYLLVTLNP